MKEEFNGNVLDINEIGCFEELTEEEQEATSGGASTIMNLGSTKATSVKIYGKNFKNIQWINRNGASIAISNSAGTLTIKKGTAYGNVSFKVGEFTNNLGYVFKNVTVKVNFTNKVTIV